MLFIAKNAKIIYLLAVLFLIVKTVTPNEQASNIVWSILFVAIVTPVLFIEFQVKRNKKDR
ncbi:positive regulator of sigma E activity [Metabacillus crassostreae]|uniref:hypothetical protein n=1 Tax=Metabacillus crassostreae TaxID=929098 RepID=UPI001958D86A|nr:hypothetical protein [Metabacillus crassostreae]MBM7602525.1 positive regulator of sigma E activity [Metabacillus crassostreae]